MDHVELPRLKSKVPFNTRTSPLAPLPAKLTVFVPTLLKSNWSPAVGTCAGDQLPYVLKSVSVVPVQDRVAPEADHGLSSTARTNAARSLAVTCLT